MKPIFKDPETQARFEKDGFVRLPLLTPQQAGQLRALYQTTAAEHEKVNIPYITTSHTNDAELIAKVDGMVQAALVPALEKYMQHYKLLFGNFLIKMPGDSSETSPHQDITFVDEEQFCSVNIWVALQDTDAINGSMYFLPGSHMFMPTIRPTHDYPWTYEYVQDEIKKRSTPFYAKAGDAFVFMHSVLHGSDANRSSQPRVAAVLAAYSEDAPLIHYYLPKGDPKLPLQKYSMTKEAYIHFVKEQPPALGKYISEAPYDFRQISVNELDEMMGTKKKGVFQLLRALFS